MVFHSLIGILEFSIEFFHEVRRSGNDIRALQTDDLVFWERSVLITVVVVGLNTFDMRIFLGITIPMIIEELDPIILEFITISFEGWLLPYVLFFEMDDRHVFESEIINQSLNSKRAVSRLIFKRI